MVDIDSTTHHSILQGPRPKGGNPPSAIVLHSGEGDSAAADISELTKTHHASSHYYVTRAGKIFQFVPDDREASHAGPTFFLGKKDWNAFSLGIETEHHKGQKWPQVQLDAIAELCKHLIAKHGILRERVAAHRWVRNPSSPLHQDPTNFTDPRLRGFITGFYGNAVAGDLFRVNTDGTNVRRDASTGLPAIDKLNAGDVIEIVGSVQGQPVKGNAQWMQRVKGQGFVHASLLDEVEIEMP